MADPVVVLQHEDQWFYFLPTDWPSPTWRAETGDRVETLTLLDRPNERCWYVGSFLADRIAKIVAQPARLIRWELADPSAESARFPAVLTREELAARRPSDDDADYPERGLYGAVTEPQPDVVTYLDLATMVRADGEPSPADGRTWTARLPYELTRHHELLHLFPGHLAGFHDALKARLLHVPGVTDVFTSAGFDVVVRVGYEPPRHRWQGRILRPGQRSTKDGRQVEETLTRRQTFNPPRHILGPTRADAVVAWDQAIAEYVEAVTEMATVRACAACNGAGVAPHRVRA